MPNLHSTHIIAIWPDALLAPHHGFNHSFFRFSAIRSRGLTIFACPAFVQVQLGAIAREDFEFRSLSIGLYDLTCRLDLEAAAVYAEMKLQGKSSFVSVGDLFTAVEFNSYSQIVNSLNAEGIITYSHLGCDVGLAVATDLSLTLKAQFKDIHVKRVQEFARLCLFHNIVAVEAIARIRASEIQPSGEHNPDLVCQNSVYSQNVAISEYLRKNGVNQCFYEASPLSRNMIKVYESPLHDQVQRRQLMAVKHDHAKPIEYFNYARTYLESRIAKSATHSYSPKAGNYLFKTIDDIYPSSANRTRYAYFTNSPDELDSINVSSRIFGLDDKIPSGKLPFTSEYENIRELVSYADSHTNQTFFIRMHPRLGADHRGLGQSYSRDEYINEILKLMPPSNVIVILPEEDIPSYWLGCWCHGILSFRGTMPLEMNLIGYQPLIGSADLGVINSSINLHANESRRSKKDWIECLSSLNNSISHEQLNQFVREFYYSRRLGMIDLDIVMTCSDAQEPLQDALERRNSVSPFPYEIQSNASENKGPLLSYLLWLQRFIYTSIAQNQDAPVYHLLEQLIAQASCLDN